MIMAPTLEIPYRVHTEEERRAFWNQVRHKSQAKQDAFWKQTIPAARERAQFLRDHGYKVTLPKEFGSVMDGYGEHQFVFPSGTQLTHEGFEPVKINDQYLSILRNWETGGFVVEPLRIVYHPQFGKEHIDAQLGLRDFLRINKIPFYDDATSDRIAYMRREQEDLTRRAENIGYLLSQLNRNNP